ncbi:F-box/kelch-repeat protein At3g23880-like [Rutidosis leptorrhynchoides]|uniref:F-box/kelch-repeat protein At3g23880-like n=1 Tax=Rutidosis leptorrhynchoides TaxID=125765 RepID=UPI003A98D129
MCIYIIDQSRHTLKLIDRSPIFTFGMAVLFPDEIVLRILGRLPTKPLVRFQCVSKHWNRMIKDPYLMKFRSPKHILVSLDNSLHLIENTSNSILNRYCPTEDVCDWDNNYEKLVFVIGTINGIVVLSLNFFGTMILYNPLTSISKKLPPPPPDDIGHVSYGLGYITTTPDDPKIVILKHDLVFRVYRFKENSWSSWNTSQCTSNTCYFDKVGTFLNGFLHWINYPKYVLTVLDLKDMMLSEIDMPSAFETRGNTCTVLGTIDGSLCLLKRRVWCNEQFEMWVMKEHGVKYQWAKTFTLFQIPRIKDLYRSWQALSIMDSGQILLVDDSDLLILYYVYNKSYKILDMPLGKDCWRGMINSVEYVKTMVSPSDMLPPSVA